jgi:hypothetical protein
MRVVVLQACVRAPPLQNRLTVVHLDDFLEVERSMRSAEPRSLLTLSAPHSGRSLIMKRLFGVCAILIVATMTSATASAAGKCGWDVHYISNFEALELSKSHALQFYTGQATIIMDDVKDPRHLTSGVCRGMATAEGGNLNWSGACWWADGVGDRWAVVWGGDTAPKPGEPDRGWFKMTGQDNTGKFADLKATGTWTGLPKGGSRWCED